MKSVNSKSRRSTTRLRLLFVAPLCLLALIAGLLAGNTSRVASAAAAQDQKAQGAEALGKGAARARGARPDGRAKPAVNKSRGASPLADPIGCVTNPAAISIGGAVNGTLASGDCQNPIDGSFYDSYSFNGTAGQLVIIEMTSAAVDSFVYVLRPNETELTYRTIFNDDSIDPETEEIVLDSRVIMVLPETGTYTILANSAFANQTGSYTLQIAGGCAATPNIVSGTVNGTLGGGDCQLHDGTLVDVYSFNATAGQQVSVSMSRTSGTVDPFLFLLSNDGFTELARNDDGLTGGGDGNFSARIPAPLPSQGGGAGSGQAVLPAAGTYYILANTLNPGENGNYSLSLSLGSNCPVQAIAGGQTLNGSLATSDCRLPFDGSFLDVYTFEGTAGQQFTATMTSTAFDTYLLLYDQQGFLVYEDDDGGGGTNARIPNPADVQTLTLPVTGTYRIYANAVAPNLTGAYTLAVTSTANCTVALAAASRQNVPAAGGTLTDNFTVPAGCPAPSISTPSTFITGLSITVNAQGQGTFTYTVAANTGAARTGTINVGGQTFTVSQVAACAVGISPTVVPFAQAGGAGRFTVVPNNQGDTQCAWTATTTANFITINTGATGTGTNRVTYTVAPNTGATRTGTITVNGQTHTVTQLGGAAPAVAFNSATFAVSEGVASRSVTVTVSRLGDTAGASTVEYRTIAETDAQAQVPCNPAVTQVRGTASPRCDFATTVDTLVFLPTEFEKTFTIPLINDVHVEGNETFQIELASPQGAGLGAQSTATVTINDDDTVQPTANPVRPPLPYNADSPRFFVRMQYLDFLSREPETNEPWSAVLFNCPNPENRADQTTTASAGCDRIRVSQSFFESSENDLKGRFVFLYHKVSFGSAQNPNFFPEYRDFVVDLARVTGRTAAETIDKRNTFSEEWVTRAAFTARYNGTTNTQFVDTLLSNVNTTPTQAGSGFTRDSLINDLNGGASRASVLRRIVESPEVSERQFSHAYVATQYYGYLRRTPDLGGYQAWLTAITAPGDVTANRRAMVDGFLNSTEYVFRFGPN